MSKQGFYFCEFTFKIDAIKKLSSFVDNPSWFESSGVISHDITLLGDNTYLLTIVFLKDR